MARKASASTSSSASPTLKTIRPTITFLHADGSLAEASPRAIRKVAKGTHKGTLCVERRNRLLAITVTGSQAARVNLADEPLAQGYANAQEVAPVITLADLGIAKKAPSEPPAKGSRKSTTAATEGGEISKDAAIEALRKHLKGAKLEEVQSAFALLVAETPKKGGKRR